MNFSRSEVNKMAVFQRFLIFFMPPALIAGGFVAYLYSNEIKTEALFIEADEGRQLEHDAMAIQTKILELASDVRYFTSNKGLYEVFNDDSPGQKRDISEVFYNFLNTRRIYDQIRLIDRQGMEKIRVNLNQGEPEIVKNEQLQSKSGRDYFKALIGLEKGQIGISSSGFNQESGRVEGAHKPIMQIGVPLIDNEGRKQGILVLNYLFDDLLSQIAHSKHDQSESHMLVNAEGRWFREYMRENQEKGSPSSYRMHSFKADFPKIWERISREKTGFIYNDEGLFSFITIDPALTIENQTEVKEDRSNKNRNLMRVVSFVPAEVLIAKPEKTLKKLLLFYVLYSVVLGAGAFLLALVLIKRRGTEKALQEYNERISNIVKTASDGIITISGEGIIETINPAALQMFGYELEETIGNNVEMLMPAPFRKNHQKYLKGKEKEPLRENGKIGVGRTLVGLRKNGTSFEIEITLSRVRREEGDSFTGIIRDTSKRIALEEEIRHNAFYDGLTNLPNRMLLLDHITQCIKQVKRKNFLFAVLFLDLDRFKTINDSLGHLAGDQVLIALSKRLTRCVRACDTVSRMGGDEMGILVEDIVDAGDVIIIANRILKSLTKPFNIDGHQLVCTSSIGIALSTTEYELPEEIMRDADIAMYRAKTAGRARYEIFNLAMRTRILDRQQMERDLRRAVDMGEFVLHYQPIVSLETGRIVSFEALVRWYHPVRGLIPPLDFIPLAEETGLIIPLGHFVFSQACRQMAIWNKRYPYGEPIGMSVNVSGKQLVEPNFIREVTKILRETKCDPKGLRVEITESLLMEDVESINEILFQLKDMNIQLYIDDFGVGYSSLSYLHKFPFDVLKIDYSFTSEICKDEAKLKIVKTILSLADQLNLDVVTEGIETDEQLSLLKELNCKYGQGYYFSRPVNAEEAEIYIVKEGNRHDAIETV